MINIHHFYDPHSGLKYLQRPLVIGNHTVACNGFIMLIQPASPEFLPPDCEIPTNLTSIIERTLGHEYQPATDRPTLPENVTA